MTSPAFSKKAKILVVDDSATIRMLLRASLEEEGFRVIEACCGQEAIALFEKIRPDAILLDVDMPGLDGFETCQEIRSRSGGEHVPILMVTGRDDTKSILRAFEVGATDFFNKPINQAILKHRVHYMLRASDALRKSREKQEQIHHLAFFDQLTGLANRSLFKASLEKALQESKGSDKQLAVLFLDLDRFKKINDTLGHHVGDLLLQSVATRIDNCIRETDAVTRSSEDESISCVSRLGGDEFTILLTDLETPGDAGKVARRIIDNIRQPHDLEDYEVFVTSSVGISLFPNDGEDADTLMKNADTAMYHSKEHGRNRLQFYKKSLNNCAAERLELENDLRRALAHQQFIVHYQPQADPQSGQIVGAEALLRWQHPTHGTVLPHKFIPLAEDLGLMPEITNWVLCTVCQQIEFWQEKGKIGVPVSVNISSYQFNQQKIPKMIGQILQDYPVDPGNLQLELPESVLLEHGQSAKAILTKLKEQGVGIAIDNFGTGHSSLTYLKSFPIDALKIDRSFIKDLSTDPNDTAIIRAIVALAHNLDLGVIAKGVEREDQLNFLRRIGCGKIQGPLVHKALPAEEFTPLLRQALTLAQA
ncbi:MAG: diguanylate cyclase [Desulfuromonas sp.]|nr:MAG: diguanylate cyclase [Desulfuromonas sp.]